MKTEEENSYRHYLDDYFAACENVRYLPEGVRKNLVNVFTQRLALIRRLYDLLDRCDQLREDIDFYKKNDLI